MGAWRTISVALMANTSGYSAGMAKAGQDTDKFGRDVDQANRKIDELDAKLGRAREGLGLGIAAGTALGLGAATKAASDLREAQAAANVVFGESIGVINEYATNAAQAIGLSKKEALDATGTFGNFFAQMGVGREEAARLSMQLTTLGADFASRFNESDATRVIEAQTAAFRGEYDALQKYVPTINAAAVEQQALAETGKANVDQLTMQEKALAAVTIMTRDAGASVGDFGRSNGSLATELKKSRAEAANTSAEIGESLLPVTAKLAETVGAAASAFGRLPGPVQTGIVGIGGMTLAVGLLLPKLAEGAQMLERIGSRSVSFGRDLIVPTQAVEGLGDANVRTTGTLGKLTGALGLALAGFEAYNTAYGYLESLTGSNTDFEGLAKDLELIASGASDLEPVFQSAGGSAEEMAQKVRDLLGSYDESGAERFGDMLLSFQNGKPSAVWDGLKESFGEGIGHQAKQDIEDLDKALADFAASSPQEAKKVFGDMVNALVDQGLTVEQISGLFPQYRTEIERSEKANASGAKATDEHADAVDRLSNAANGFLANASAFGDAQRAMADADEAVNDAVIGVADAQQRVADAEERVAEAQQGVADASAAVADARGRVADAEEAVATARRGVADAERAVTDAQKGAARAAEEVVTATEAVAQALADARIDSDYMADSLQGVADAEEALERAQQDSLTAQERLTAARAGYSDVMKGLARDAAGSADDVLSAEIRLRKAQQAAAELGADGKPVTADERLAAQIAIREAERALEVAKEREAEARAEYERQQAAGVEGSDAVVDAHKDVEEAADNEAAAQGRLEDAVQTVADTQVTALGRVEDAQRTLAEKIDARAAADQRVIDARQGVIDANRDVQKAAEGVWAANRDVATAIDNVRGAQKKVTDAKDEVVTARDGVRQAERDVETAVKDQYKAYKDWSEFWRPGSPARERMEWLTGQLQLQHSYLLQPITVPFVDIFGGGRSAGTKGGVPTGANGVGSFDKPNIPTGWVKQPNGRWYHQRMPGEADYGDGYSDYRPGATPTGRSGASAGAYAGVPAMAPNWAQPGPYAATSLNPRQTVDVGGIQVDARGIESPEAVATMVSAELGWKLAIAVAD